MDQAEQAEYNVEQKNQRRRRKAEENRDGLVSVEGTGAGD